MKPALLLCLLSAFECDRAGVSHNRRAPGAPFCCISIDGLRPDYVLEADRHGLTIPNLRALVRDGASATSVRGVLPTSTYPSHTTIVTGVTPAKHGIVDNKPFGGAVRDLDIWISYAEDIRVPTLWDAASQGGYVVGSVSWPVTVGATTIAFNIPEFNLTRTAEDVKITRSIATPGLMAGLAERAGPYTTDVGDSTKRDWARTRYALEMIRQKRTRFLTLHLAAPDSHPARQRSIRGFARSGARGNRPHGWRAARRHSR